MMSPSENQVKAKQRSQESGWFPPLSICFDRGGGGACFSCLGVCASACNIADASQTLTDTELLNLGFPLLRRWEEDDVNRKLDRKMTDAFEAVWNIHLERKTTLRTAAFVKALQRVTQAELHRGFD